MESPPSRGREESKGHGRFSLPPPLWGRVGVGGRQQHLTPLRYSFTRSFAGMTTGGLALNLDTVFPDEILEGGAYAAVVLAGQVADQPAQGTHVEAAHHAF